MIIKPDLTGKQIGYWHILGKIQERRKGIVYWECQCVCGNIRAVSGPNLRERRSTNCGCIQIKNRTLHGHKTRNGASPTYMSWLNMKKRCNNPNVLAYRNYGARGITYDSRWESFDNFLHDMGKKPSKELTLERIDNNGNYIPSNCKWDTRKAQMLNTRVNRLITHNGTTKPLMAWSRELSIPYPTLKWRLNQGWDNSEVLRVTNG